MATRPIIFLLFLTYEILSFCLNFLLKLKFCEYAPRALDIFKSERREKTLKLTD